MKQQASRVKEKARIFQAAAVAPPIPGSRGRAATAPSAPADEVEIVSAPRESNPDQDRPLSRAKRSQRDRNYLNLRIPRFSKSWQRINLSAVAFHPRNYLPHEIPLWIDPSREIYFVTINCDARGKNQLALPEIAKSLFETIEFRQQNFLWWPHLFLLMPDHLHALLSFPPSGKPVTSIIRKWKEWTAKDLRIIWQDDYFEHRLRAEESRRQKADYILANPVRAKLSACPEDWPYVYFGSGQKPNFAR